MDCQTKCLPGMVFRLYEQVDVSSILNSQQKPARKQIQYDAWSKTDKDRPAYNTGKAKLKMSIAISWYMDNLHKKYLITNEMCTLPHSAQT